MGENGPRQIFFSAGDISRVPTATLGKQIIHLCIFNSSYGRHNFLRLPFGLCLALELSDSPGSAYMVFCSAGKEQKHMTRSSDQLLKDPDQQSPTNKTPL